MRLFVFLPLPFLFFLFIFLFVLFLLIILLFLSLFPLHFLLFLFLHFFLYSLLLLLLLLCGVLDLFFTSLWIHCFKPENSISQSVWCISQIILSVIFTNKYVHFSKLFIQTAPHNRWPAKACNLLKICSSSLKTKNLSMNRSAIRMKNYCVKFVHKQDFLNA